MASPDTLLAQEVMQVLLRVINSINQGRRTPRDYGAAGRLTLLEAQICQMISRNEGVTGGELSAQLGVTRSAISQTLSKLKAKGLLVESSDAADAKRKKLFMTDRGHQAADVAEGYLMTLTREIFDEPREELEAYLRFVQKLETFHRSALETLGEEKPE